MLTRLSHGHLHTYKLTTHIHTHQRHCTRIHQNRHAYRLQKTEISTFSTACSVPGPLTHICRLFSALMWYNSREFDQSTLTTRTESRTRNSSASLKTEYIGDSNAMRTSMPAIHVFKSTPSGRARVPSRLPVPASSSSDEGWVLFALTPASRCR
jgi:hypothetical protein